MAEAVFDPANPDFRANPHPFYDLLRVEDPVHRAASDMVVLTRYDDVAHTLRSNDFSRDVEANGNPPSDPVVRARWDRRRNQSAAAKTILNLDPPDHTRLRRLVSQAFTPTAIDRLRPRVQQLVDDVLDLAEERGEMELVDELAFPVPFQVISDLLDMPTDRTEEMRNWSQHITAALEPTATEAELDLAEAAVMQLIPYLIEVIEQRRHNLGDDVLSGLLMVEEAGDRLDMLELIAFVALLYIAGHETTVNLIGNATLALFRHPDELRRMRDDPSLAAIDELLRYDGPVRLTVRVPTTEVRYRGATGADDVVVEPGTLVATVLGAANRDPSVFDDPHTLRLDRANANRHLAFAAGIHYCLGASLARLETQVAIGTLLRRFPNLSLAGEPEWRDRFTIRGVSRLPLSVR